MTTLPARSPCHTTRAHQVTVAALFILQHSTYDRYCEREATEADDYLKFKDWSYHRGEDIPQFQYWSIVLELELLLHIYVCSLRAASLNMYLDALTELAGWFHALDQTNYARWIPVHLKDMAELPERHPEIARMFREDSFTVHNTTNVFSSIPIDQAHEQNNGCTFWKLSSSGLTLKTSKL